MTASKDRDGGIANRVISGNERTNSLALTSSRVPSYSFVQFRPRADSTFSIRHTKEKLVVSHVTLGFQSLERSNSRDVTARLQTHPVRRHFRWLREGKALEAEAERGGERGEDRGPECGHYAVESSSLRRVRFDSRQRGPAAEEGSAHHLQPRQGAPLWGVVRAPQSLLPRGIQALMKRHL